MPMETKKRILSLLLASALLAAPLTACDTADDEIDSTEETTEETTTDLDENETIDEYLEYKESLENALKRPCQVDRLNN